MTAAATSVDQLVLPGQAAAPAGPVNVSGMYLFHFAFRRDLDLLPAVARATPLADREVWAAVAARWHTFAAVLHHHHEAEDRALWPTLISRATASERATLEAMEAEHDRIGPLLVAVDTHLSQVMAGDDARLTLARVLQEARTVLGQHLDHEEIDAMALVQKYLGQADWDRLEKKEFAKDQGLRDLIRMLPWLLHELPEDAARVVWSSAPGPMKVIWAFTHKRFERADVLIKTHLPGQKE